jgi:glycosyltransferase involved in cell wall biosynthesis
MEVHLIGPYPPPFGGVSVHIRRLRTRLLETGHDCVVWSHEARPELGVRAYGSNRQGYRALQRLDRCAVLHFHGRHLAAGLLSCRGRRVVWTMHNERIGADLLGGRFPLQWAFRRVSAHYFRKICRYIAISHWVRQELVAFGCPDAAIRVISSYLRPDEDETAPEENLAALEAFRGRFPRLVSTSSWAPRFYRGADMYGIDLCIEMLPLVQQEHPDLGLVLVLPWPPDAPYLQELRRRAEALGVQERILWLHKPGAYHPIQRRCDLFIRATNTDGFGVTMAEAMEFDVPVIASDAAPRPAGSVIFRDRDANDLAQKVSESLHNLPALIARTQALKEPDHFVEVLAVYQELADQG